MTVHIAALDDERLVVLGELLDRLGSVDGLAIDKRNRGGPGEQVVKTLDPGLRRRTLDERVLGDGVRGDTAERTAKFGQIGHSQAAVLGDHSGRRGFEPLRDFGNRGGLVSLGHACLLVDGSRPARK